MQEYTQNKKRLQGNHTKMHTVTGSMGLYYTLPSTFTHCWNSTLAIIFQSLPKWWIRTYTIIANPSRPPTVTEFQTTPPTPRAPRREKAARRHFWQGDWASVLPQGSWAWQSRSPGGKGRIFLGHFPCWTDRSSEMASVQGLPSNRATQREGVSKRNRTKTTQTLGGQVGR